MNGYFRVFSFDTEQYRFSEWAAGVLGVANLAAVHERPDLAGVRVYDAMKTCLTQLKEGFLEGEPILRRFYKEHMAGGLGIPQLGFQCPPTFRIHLPQCPTVSAFHRDRDYGVTTGRLCVWLPLTKVWESNSLWIAFDENGASQPIDLDYGQFIVFDSANLLHGSKMNETKAARVSFDSRFIPGQPALLPWGKPASTQLAAERSGHSAEEFVELSPQLQRD